MVDFNMWAGYKLNISDLLSNPYVKVEDGSGQNHINIKDRLKVVRVRILAQVTFKYASEDGNYASMTLDDGTGNVRVKAWQNIKVVLETEKDDLIDIIAMVREWNGEVYLVPEVLRIVDNPELKTLRSLEILRFKKEIGIIDKETIEKEITSIKNQNNPDADDTDTDDGTSKSESKQSVSESVQELEIKNDEMIESSKKSEGSKIDVLKDRPETQDTESEPEEKTLRVLIIEMIEKLDDGDGAAIDDVLDSIKSPTKDTESIINELLSEGTCYEPRAGKIKVL
ncbi:MAG: hypothetical protein GQ477_01255 [Nanohaloarchaea archaeon]|nr:hypothetical protein [Candidatus Nanohaloarchaea archaeon]